MFLFVCLLLLLFSELKSCVNVEVAVLSSPSLIVLMVSVDVKQHYKKCLRMQKDL